MFVGFQAMGNGAGGDVGSRSRRNHGRGGGPMIRIGSIEAPLDQVQVADSYDEVAAHVTVPRPRRVEAI